MMTRTENLVGIGGAIGICADCGAISVTTAGLQLREPTIAELHEAREMMGERLTADIDASIVALRARLAGAGRQN